MMNRQWLFAFFFILLGLHLASATVFLNIYGNGTVQPGQSVVLTGSLDNDTSTSGPRPYINISTTGNFSGVTNYSTSNSNTTFYLNLTAPNATGEHVYNISTNSSDIRNRSITLYVSNATTANISYVGAFPPFTNGTTFTFKLTLLNGTTVLVNNTPNVTIYVSNGPRVSWTITALNTSTGSNGAQFYNVTIPSNAETESYILIVERGVYASVFQVKSGYVVAVNTLTRAEEVTSNFAQNTVVNILTKIRDVNSNPVTVDGAYVAVTLPNSTTRNLTLSSHPSSSGYYNNTFNETSATGTYSIQVVARIGTTQIESTSAFNIKTFSARLEPQKEFFFEWGGKSSFKPGQRVALNLLVTDLTNDSVVPSAPSSSLNCTRDTQVLDIIFVSNSTSINRSAEVNTSNTSLIDGNGQYLTSNVCRFNLATAPQSGGLYNVKINVTYGGNTQTIDGFFAVSRYFMKAAPVSNLGGSEDFMSMVTPGENVTLTVNARNTGNDTDVPGSEITNIRVLRLVPLELKGGGSENTTVVYTVTNGTSSTDPSIQLHVPATSIGPILVDVEATIGGETVKGDSFFLANHLMGFMSPGGQGQGEEFSGGFFSSCSGNITFSGMVMETKTLTAAQGVGIVGVIQAREELTGKDVTGYINVLQANSSDSNGHLRAKINFNPTGGYSFSGFYFMIFNASYKGQYAGIPAGFMCKKLNFFPQVQAVGSTSFGWRVAPNANLTISLQDVKRLNDSFVIGNQSNVTISQIFNFNPGKGGMKVLFPKNASAMFYNITKVGTSNSVSFNISPSDFTSSGQNLTDWPNGFMDLQPRVCTQSLEPAGGACDTGFGGFQVVPFDAWFEGWSFGEVSAGDVKSYTIDIRSNISRSSQNDALNSFYNGTNQTGFQVKIGKPWEGEQTSLSGVSSRLLDNGWNRSTDFSYERWNISFQIPATGLKKGDTMVTITVNNSQGQSMDLDMFFQVVKYTVTLPSEEGVGDPTSGGFDGRGVAVHAGLPDFSFNNASSFGWNWTAVVVNNGVNSTTGRVCFRNNFNATRYGGMGNLPVAVKDNVRIAVVDRYSSTYDTIVLNNTTNGAIIILNTTQRNVSALNGQGSWYFWEIKECGYFTGVNTTSAALPQGQATWGGSHQVNKQFAIPYVVRLANNPQSGVTVSVNGMGKQDNRGFGFESKLTGAAGTNVASGNNYSFVAVNTDANGVAFVTLNSTAAGRLVSFWKINATSSDSDTATMMTGTFFEAKAFKTSGSALLSLTKSSVTLTWNNNSPEVWGGFGSNSTTAHPSGDVEHGVYNGTIVESSLFDFAWDGTADTWYIVYGPNTNKTKMATSKALAGTTGVQINSTSSTSVGSNSVKVFSRQGNISSNSSMILYLFQSSPTGSAFVNSATANVTVQVCAETFDRPNGLPREGATVQLFVTDWFSFPPTTKNLDMFELANHTNVTSSLARTGPSGCVALNVGPGQLGTWPQGRPLFIEGTITYGGSQESVYVTDVYRSTV